MDIEVRHLTLLLAVADAGSITGAARVLSLTQSNLAQQVRRAEGALGVAVFERGPRGIRVTEEGRPVLARARVVVAEMGRLADPMPRVERPAVVRLRWSGFDPTPGLRRFSLAGPGGGWEAARVRPEEAVHQLRRGLAEIYIGLQWPHMGWPDTVGLVSSWVFDVKLQLLAPVGHRLAGARAVSLAALTDHEWVDRVDRQTAEMECRRFGFTPALTHVGTVDEQHVRIRNGMVGLSVELVPPPTGVVAIPYTDPSPVHCLLLYRPDVVRAEYASALVGALRRWRLGRSY